MNPETEILVKISKEDAGAISLTRVLQQRVAVRDLVAQIVAITGKDGPRIASILQRGSLVKGLSRLRWQGFDATVAVDACLLAIPDPWPQRPFVLEEVESVEVANARHSVSVPMHLMRRGRLLRRGTFLDALRAMVPLAMPVYQHYDYEARADAFSCTLSAECAHGLQQAARLLPDAALRSMLMASPAHRLRFLVPRA